MKFVFSVMEAGLNDHKESFSRWPSSSNIIFNQAVVEGDLAKIKFLLKYGGKQIAVNENNKHGLTPLQQSCVEGNVELAMLLLDHGADVEKRDKNGWTALHFAIVAGHCNIVSLLINSCADLTRVDCKGRLPIDLAQTEDMLVLIAKAMENAGFVETARLYLEKWELRSPPLSPSSLQEDSGATDIELNTKMEGFDSKIKTACGIDKNKPASVSQTSCVSVIGSC
ncbi:protein phosphatase 1 regulatory subunit 16A-like [Acropora millepora]|uniref:protein phosphatase 1 regulatory subunit 16A-like n=1 Tax=Acropora millepora TaxID=45264 RepID=UPI0010FC917D|nr:protein phosphatase 1 regulatory subunit 16A-like [Acropora millepora]